MSDFIISDDGKTIEQFNGQDKSVVIPEGVEIIEDGAFSFNFTMEAISLPETLKEIRTYAFSNCEFLKSIEIPGSVSRIENKAFCECKALEKLVLHEGLMTVSPLAFEKCTSLLEVTLPSSVVDVGASAFSHCDKLSRVTILGEDTKLEWDVFAYCKSLKIDNCMFTQGMLSKDWSRGYPGITSQVDAGICSYLGIGDDNGCIVYEDTLIKHIGGSPEVTVSEGVTTIGSGAFDYYGNEDMKPLKVHLPKTIQKIEGSRSFDIEYILDQDAFKTTKKLAKEFANSLGKDPACLAYTTLFQSGKSWIDAVEDELKDVDVNVVAATIVDTLGLEIKKSTNAVAERAVQFFAAHRNMIKQGIIDDLRSMLDNNASKWTKAIELFKIEFVG